MSRCFPYPPPGYALTSARKEALIESIKFQNEKGNAEELRKKDRKREKKEKKKEKKEKRIRNQETFDSAGGHVGEKFWSDAKVGFLNKGSNSESEQAEKSSLTEEHAKPVCLLVPSTSSDSTENSHKRKRPPSSVDHSRGRGNIIRIRLSSSKQNQPNASVDEQKHCSTSGRTHFPAETRNDTASKQRTQGFCSTSGSTAINFGRSLVPKTGVDRNHMPSKQINAAPVFEKILLPVADADMTHNVGRSLVPKTGGNQNHMPFKQINAAPVSEKISLPVAESVMKPLQKEGLLYKNLIENWVAPKFTDVCVGNTDEDWLFGAKNKVEQSEKKSMCRDESTHCNTSSLWQPRAQYLPEVDVYALPYTLPF